MSRKIQILIVSIIFLSLGIWIGQNIYERAGGKSVSEPISAQADGPSKAILQQENIRNESTNTLPANTDKSKENSNQQVQYNPAIYPSADTALTSTTVIAGEKTVALSVPAETTFYDALVEYRNRGEIEFAGKNYPVLGFFVTNIGTLHARGGLDLLYYINGTEATVGISSYVLKDGDVIEWKLE
ncbi:MAG: DUF4430 domain-containing protein [bacterium]|nr:DUF4430 domain-containing protein [bacterium]